MRIWINLARALKRTGIFVAHRIKPKLLKERYEAGMASIALSLDGRSILGIAVLWPTSNPGVVENGTVFVRKRYRKKVYSGNQTICQAILAACANTLRAKNLRGIMVTDNPNLAKKACAEEIGWAIDDPAGHGQAIRWLLLGGDRVVRADSDKAGARTVLVFYPE